MTVIRRLAEIGEVRGKLWDNRRSSSLLAIGVDDGARDSSAVSVKIGIGVRKRGTKLSLFVRIDRSDRPIANNILHQE